MQCDERGDPQVSRAGGAPLVVRRASGAGTPAAARRRRRPGGRRGRRVRWQQPRCCGDLGWEVSVAVEGRRGGPARAPPEGCACVRGDARRLPFADEQFDLVMSTDMWEHVEEDDQVAAEAFRVLPPRRPAAADRASGQGAVERARRGPGTRAALRACRAGRTGGGRRVRGHGHARLERAAPPGRARQAPYQRQRERDGADQPRAQPRPCARWCGSRRSCRCNASAGSASCCAATGRRGRPAARAARGAGAHLRAHHVVRTGPGAAGARAAPAPWSAPGPRPTGHVVWRVGGERTAHESRVERSSTRCGTDPSHRSFTRLSWMCASSCRASCRAMPVRVRYSSISASKQGCVLAGNTSSAGPRSGRVGTATDGWGSRSAWRPQLPAPRCRRRSRPECSAITAAGLRTCSRTYQQIT